MKVGDYVRTKNGYIYKIEDGTEFYEDSVDVGIGVIPDVDGIWVDEAHFQYVDKREIIKSSPNIIDLIEVGDYVNGVLVESIYQREKDKLYIHSFDTEIMMCFTNNNIKSIVTKEQIEQMEYKIND